MKESSLWAMWTWICLIAAAVCAAGDLDICAWTNVGLAFYYRSKYKTCLAIEEAVDDIIELIEKINKEKDEE